MKLKRDDDLQKVYYDGMIIIFKLPTVSKVVSAFLCHPLKHVTYYIQTIFEMIL